MAMTTFVNESSSFTNTLTPAAVCHHMVFDNAEIEAWYRGVGTYAYSMLFDHPLVATG